MKTIAKLSTLIVLVAAITGCARFSTKQVDVSYDDQGNTIREVTTKASAYTLIQSKSNLTDWKAEQDDGSQGASVGSLSQESSAGTNVVAALEAILNIIQEIK